MRSQRERERELCRCSIHGGARPRLGRGGKGGQDDQALGRSRGGFSTKIHLKVDLDGLPSPSI